ncbi:hypothetical protein CFC21_101325 [Triticum aestivum]|uniref:Chalcone-flavonone isomerase family protein n=2 Tax=Triticum aestivum TaxID=4565 RepID=A0A9R1M2Z2_WHEAT|nr:chalcone--flavanone isomerase-like [Triticum aestivum]KAF7099725.1 hypothetical protein CFC21_101325 [Triticum aestivum]
MEDTTFPAGITDMEVGRVVFGASATPPHSSKILFLGGAGERIGPRHGTLKLVTVIGVYLEQSAVPFLTLRWQGKPAEELARSADFFRDIVAGPFDKFTQVTLVDTLTGQEYSDKVTENCVNIWKSSEHYSVDEGHGSAATSELKGIFYPASFPTGSTIFFTHSADGVLQVAFSDDTKVPEQESGRVDSRALSEAVLESIIGDNGVSPLARRSLAFRLCGLINHK